MALPMTSPPLDAIMQRTESLIKAALENLDRARELCEMSQRLRAENADYREFLSEERLRVLERNEARLDGRA